MGSTTVKTPLFMGLAAVVSVVAIICFTAFKKAEINRDVEVQKAITKTEIEQNTKLQRTKERMKALPWWDEQKGGE